MPRSWHANLSLQYERRGDRTVLASRSFDGPLVVQKSLYPEGDATCHTIVVHPPAGIVGGDALDITVECHPNAHVLLTTPGAGKWYRSGGPWARMHVSLEVKPGACVEWLPQEAIFFDGALADITTRVTLQDDASFIGWDILCFGRRGSGERYMNGECRLRTEIVRDDVPLWIESGRLTAGSPVFSSPAGLHGRSICGTLLATLAAPQEGDSLLRACRAEQPASGEGVVTALPALLVARYLGDSSEDAQRYFERIWQHVRPHVTGRQAMKPRIWNT